MFTLAIPHPPSPQGPYPQPPNNPNSTVGTYPTNCVAPCTVVIEVATIAIVGSELILTATLPGAA